MNHTEQDGAEDSTTYTAEEERDGSKKARSPSSTLLRTFVLTYIS